MNNWLYLLNTLIQIGILASALMAAFFKKLLPSILALGACGAFMALEFLILQAPDVAIAEAAVGAVLATTLFVIALKKVRKKEDEK